MSRHTRQARRLGVAVASVAAVAVAVASPASAAWSTNGSGAGTGKAVSLAAPTSLGTAAGSPAHTAINVTFSASSNPSGTSYTVTRDKKKDGTAGPEVACSGLTASPCADSGLTASTTYTYTVKAVVGGWSAQAAGSVNRTTSAAPVTNAITLTGCGDDGANNKSTCTGTYTGSITSITVSWTKGSVTETRTKDVSGGSFEIQSQNGLGAGTWTATASSGSVTSNSVDVTIS